MKKIITLLLLLCSVMTVSAQKYVYIKHASDNWKENTLTASKFDNKHDSIIFKIRSNDVGRLIVSEPTSLGDHSIGFQCRIYALNYVLKGGELGACYSSVNPEPTINDSKIIDTDVLFSSASDVWNVNINNLDSATRYYYRFYATLGDTTFYSEPNNGLTGTPPLEAVDLGLSVKWATANIGAVRPEDYGYYISWGETRPKDVYSLATYKYYDAATGTFTKYNDTDSLVTLTPEDDAATANFGDGWRMPTLDEARELTTQCTWKATTINDVDGYTVTGPNGNSIFIPLAGLRSDKNGYNTGLTFQIWTSTLNTVHKNPSHIYLSFESSGAPHIGVGTTISAKTRNYGYSIRAVYTK